MKNAVRDNMAELRDIRVENDFAMDADTATLQWWEPVAVGSTPSGRLIEGERAIQLANAMESLPDNQRIAIELRHLNGMKLSEVGEEMGKTPDAVVSLIRRGMQTLKNWLKEVNS